ncbi:glycosyltransferase family 32 protein [Mycena rebaudengoi]|nr:glycosyltransferase family 32 protein [Mycena rebaudengoi]
MLSLKRPLIAVVVFLTGLYFLCDLSVTLDSKSSPWHESNEYQLEDSELLNPVAKLISNLLEAPQIGAINKGKTTSKPPHNQEPLTSDAQPQSQSSQLATSLIQLEAQLALQFPYEAPSAQTPFPPYIWQTWPVAPSSSAFKDELRAPVASWPTLSPEFQHQVLTYAAASALVHSLYASVPPVLAAYAALPLPILKADFFRYLILLARGGVYSDIDTTALTPIREWLARAAASAKKPAGGIDASALGLVIGIEADAGTLGNWRAKFPRRVQLCQWTIQARAGHPVLRAAVANITIEALRRTASGSWTRGTGVMPSDDILELTGPAVWTDVVLRGEGRDDVARLYGHVGRDEGGGYGVLPITSFNPDNWHLGARGVKDRMAFAKHGFQGSWKSEAVRRVGEVAFDTSDE